MTTNELGWITEDKLAESLGWECFHVDNGDPMHPHCRFRKGKDAIWDIDTCWIRAKNNRNHRRYATLEAALKGEKE